jgi:cytochrome c oxidase subunit 2
MLSETMRLLFAVLLLVSVVAVSLKKLPIPADEYVYCTVCHGVQLMGNPITKSPRLSGMESWYVENQLRAFKKGWRGGHENDVIGLDMRQTTLVLSEEQIREVAEFVAATRSDIPPVTIEGDVENGKRLYSTCAACHGVRAEGNIALASPALTGLDDWYLVQQLRNFKNGARGSQPGDTYGMQMRAAAGTLPDDRAVHDVVKYISTLEE